MPQKIGQETLLIGSLAVPNRQGQAVRLYNQLISGVNKDYIYLAFEPNNLEKALAGMKALGIRGFSVSRPFKEEVIQHLDHIDAASAAIGAVNTILNENGRLRGFNTDWQGAVAALEQTVNLAGKKAAVIGAGGVARAVVFGLRHCHVEVSVFNRRKARARKLAADLDCVVGGTLDNLHQSVHQFDIIINATPVGGVPDISESPIEEEILRPGTVLLDTVFNPEHTTFLRYGRRVGCRTVSGCTMLLHQAALQVEIFTGCRPHI
jgi:shikimate dehydrogenase